MAEPTLRSVVDLVHGWYPPGTAEGWDRVGLVHGDLDQPIHEDARSDHLFRFDSAGFDQLADLCDCGLCRHRHQRIEVSPRQPIGQVAHVVAQLALDKRDIGLQPALAHVHMAIEFLDLLAFGQFGAIGGGRIEGRNARTRRANAFGQRALWHQFKRDVARKVGRVERLGVGRAREGTDHPGNHPGLDHCRDADAPVTRVVVDNGQLARAAGGAKAVDQRVDQLDRRARAAKSTDHHGCPVGNIRDGLFHC